MGKDDRTPPETPKAQSHEARIAGLEEDVGGIVSELSTIQSSVQGHERRITGLEEDLQVERISETNISLSPKHARVRFKGISGWVIVSVIALMAATVAAWLLKR